MKIVAGVIVLLAVVVGLVQANPTSRVLYTVDETQLAIVTRFGEPRKSIKNPGLYVKTPFVEKVTYFDKRLLIFDAPPESLLTKDKKRLVIDAYARGRIVDPLLFFRRVRTEGQAASRVIDIVASELRREIGLDDQSEIIAINREDIMNRVRDAVRVILQDAVEGFGIQVEDVRIKRADFPVEIADSIYARMQAERVRIADRERAEGAEVDAQVRAEVDKLATIIKAEAERDANIVEGCGEAEAIKVFASALEQDPEFYTFQRSLETYKTNLAQNTKIVGSAADLGQMFEDIRQSVIEASEPPVADAGDAVLDGSGLDEPGSRCAEVSSVNFLAAELNVDRIVLELKSVEPTAWPDGGLGCREEGRFYTSGVIRGFNLAFDIGGTTHEVHTNLQGSLLATC